MQQVTLNINNPQIEAMLFNISSQKNRKIKTILSDIIEQYIYSYSVKEAVIKVNTQNKKIIPLSQVEQFYALNEYNKKHELVISNNINIAELTNDINNVIL